eukprot:scaffold4173_cov117-Isochrysis_galbana.AAC.10
MEVVQGLMPQDHANSVLGTLPTTSPTSRPSAPHKRGCGQTPGIPVAHAGNANQGITHDGDGSRPARTWCVPHLATSPPVDRQCRNL